MYREIVMFSSNLGYDDKDDECLLGLRRKVNE